MAAYVRTILLLGAGELGKELTISLKRLGQRVIAVDRYVGAPAMQVADGFEVISMLDSDALQSIVEKHRPDLIVPEIEAIRTEKLAEFEKSGITVVPTAEAAHLTMNRNAIRDLASQTLGLRTARYLYAENESELLRASQEIGFPNVVKPVMSSSGKGQSVVKSPAGVPGAWTYACDGMRGDQKKVTDRLGGAGLFGVEFFLSRNGKVYFTELSPRPHDTGLVTLISQDLSEFDLHARAILGLPISRIQSRGAAASAAILADRELKSVDYMGVDRALSVGSVDVRIFGKPNATLNRRMGVALALGSSIDKARKLARAAAAKVKTLGS